jgi:Cytochrome c7 and related cytochrome c
MNFRLATTALVFIIATGVYFLPSNPSIPYKHPASAVISEASADSDCRNFNTWHTAWTTVGKHALCSCQQCHFGSTAQGTSKVCASCHNGQIAMGKPIKHVPTGTATCDSCHGDTWVPVSTSKTHQASVGTTCETCHNGTLAKGKSTRHLPTTLTCSTCHVQTTWSADFNHAKAGIVIGSGTCATCHNGTISTGKSSRHIPTTATCDTCHKSFSGFDGAVMNHTGIVDSCVSCHNGIFATGKLSAKFHPAPTPDTCETCHNVTGWPCKYGALDKYKNLNWYEKLALDIKGWLA